jgi:hypothetical protein
MFVERNVEVDTDERALAAKVRIAKIPDGFLVHVSLNVTPNEARCRFVVASPFGMTG